MKKRIHLFFVLLCICIGLFYPGTTVQAASGKTAVSVSSGTVNIGDTVTVSVSASGASGEHAVATMTVSWDAAVLQLVSCSTTYGGGGGSIKAVGDNFTVTLSAVSAGTSAISVSGSDGVLFDTDEELESMAGSSASVTVNNAAGGSAGNAGAAGGGSAGNGDAAGGGTPGAGGENNGGGAPLSADNSLKSLTISPGTLSPAFAGPTTKYSATVAGNVTSVAVSAVPANEKAVVESVTGNEGLKVGTNAVKIVVRAENGVTATYTINVTRQGESAEPPVEQKPEEDGGENETEAPELPEESVLINGIPCQIREDFAPEEIPANFSEQTILYHGTPHNGVSFNNGSVSLLWMMPVDESAGGGGFFVYDETRDMLYPFVRIGSEEKYVIALLAPVDAVIPEHYQQTGLQIGEGENITAYQTAASQEGEIGSDFYLFYGVNSDGTENWYQYDRLEGTYQRLNPALTAVQGEDGEEEENIAADPLQEEYNELSDRYKEARRSMGGVIGILVFVIAVLLILLVNQLIHRFKKGGPDGDDPDDDLEDEDDLYEDDLDEDDLEDDFIDDDYPDEDDSDGDDPDDDFTDDDDSDGDDLKDDFLDDDGFPDDDDDPDDGDSAAAAFRGPSAGRTAVLAKKAAEADAWDDSAAAFRGPSAGHTAVPAKKAAEAAAWDDSAAAAFRGPSAGRTAVPAKKAAEADARDDWDDAARDDGEADTWKEDVRAAREADDWDDEWDDGEEDVRKDTKETGSASEEQKDRLTSERKNAKEIRGGSVRKTDDRAVGSGEEMYDDWPDEIESSDGWSEPDDWPDEETTVGFERKTVVRMSGGAKEDGQAEDDAWEAGDPDTAETPLRRRSGGNTGRKRADRDWEDTPAPRSGRRFGGNLSDEEYAERREAAERFFAEEPVKKAPARRMKKTPEPVRLDKVREKTQSAEHAAAAGKSEKTPSVKAVRPQKSGKEKGDGKKKGTFEVIDFNDL